jgi:hypothetical protein
MTDHHAGGNRTDVDQVRDVVGEAQPSVPVYPSVGLSPRDGAARPAPACVGRQSAQDLRPEPLQRWGVGGAARARVRAEASPMIGLGDAGLSALLAGPNDGRSTLKGHREASLPGVAPPAIRSRAAALRGKIIP